NLTRGYFLGLFGKSVGQNDPLPLIPKTKQPERVISQIRSDFPKIPGSFELLEVMPRHHWKLLHQPQHQGDLLSLPCIELGEKHLNRAVAARAAVEVNLSHTNEVNMSVNRVSKRPTIRFRVACEWRISQSLGRGWLRR